MISRGFKKARISQKASFHLQSARHELINITFRKQQFICNEREDILHVILQTF